tara:strand:+ start:251 stop:469 length:219 start_codon:yes stop_codon:yes gene_type:complete
MTVEKLDKLNKNIKKLHLFIHYIYFTVLDYSQINSLYKKLFKSDKTKPNLYSPLKRIADNMSKIAELEILVY